MKAIERLYQYFDFKQIKPTAFEKEIGISNGYFGKMNRRVSNIGSDIIEKIIENCPDLNIEWLISGVGEMIKTKSNLNLTVEKEPNKTKSNLNLTVENGKENSNNQSINEKYKKAYQIPEVKYDVIEEGEVSKYMLKTDSSQEIQSVPLYEMEAVAGLVPLFNDAMKNNQVGEIQIPNLPKCDGAVYITGDSMYPLLKSGDIVLYKRVSDIINNIFWGEMYLVSIDMDGEEYVTVKYIQKGVKPDFVRLVSHNQHHDEKELPISKIRALAFIKASIRINSMK